MYSNLVECLSHIVGSPATVWQENALYCGFICLLILALWAIFKIVNYLFHI